MKLSKMLMEWAEENEMHEPGDGLCHCDFCQIFVPAAIEAEIGEYYYLLVQHHMDGGKTHKEKMNLHRAIDIAEVMGGVVDIYKLVPPEWCE